MAENAPAQATPPAEASRESLGTLLLTGASGWLGTRLLGVLLREGVEPLGLPRWDALRILLQPHDPAPDLSLAPAGQGRRVSVVRGDLRDPATRAELCRGASGGTLIHTAGVIHPRRVRDFMTVNTQATEHLLEEAIRADVRRAVVVSSNSPLGCNPSPEHRFTERSEFNPYMGYGRSKMLMEQAVQRVQQTGRLETVILRPPWFYGPYQPPRQTLFFEMIRDGRAPIVGSGDNMRSMVYIDNLCQGVLLAALVPHANGKVYWIADREAYSMNQIIDTVARLLEHEFGFKVRHGRLRLPNVAGELATWLDGAAQRVGLYLQKLHVLGEMNKSIACLIDRAEAELGYAPQFALEEGMRRSIQYCVEQGLLSPASPSSAAAQVARSSAVPPPPPPAPER